MEPRHVAIILAGGGGTRLWPVSTDDSPKQLNSRLFRVPLVKQAYERTHSILSPENTYILTTERLAPEIRAATGISDSHLLIEPMKRDTAAAFAFAAGYFAGISNAVCAMLNADHVIEDIPAFEAALRDAYAHAGAEERLVTIGTVPDAPATELGYVLRDAEKGRDAALVEGFVEKPNEETAQELIAGGALWNTGMYVWRPEILLAIMKETAPSLAAGAREAGSAYRAGEQGAVSAWYEQVPCGSFDRFVSEKTKRFAVVESAHRWRDIGTWQTFYEVLPKDKSRNVCILPSDGSVTFRDSRGCIVAPTHKNVVLVGVDDLVVAAHGENLLIAHRDHAHHIKDVLKDGSRTLPTG